MKGQSTIIGFILITAIAIIIVSVTLFWAGPLLEKSRDQIELQRLEQKFIELHNAVESVANGQGSLSIPFTINKGTINFDSENNSIVYESQLNLNAPVPCKAIFANVTCDNLKEYALLGEEESAYLLEYGAVNFVLHYRILNSSAAPAECYRIKLIPGEQTTAGTGRHTIFFTWLQENTTTTPGCSTFLKEQFVEFNVK